MKKLFAILLSVLLVVGLFAGCAGSNGGNDNNGGNSDNGNTADDGQSQYMKDLIAAAKAEGTLVVYGSCEEEYLAVACEKFEELYGIKVEYQRLSTGEVQSKVEEEAGKPSGDVWFGGTTDPYNVCAAEGLLMAYEAQNASHLLGNAYRDADGYWYGIYKGILV